jgi:uncharacterized membrane protein YhaH (DUF805 family)
VSQPNDPQPTYGGYPPSGQVAGATPSMSFPDAVRTCLGKYVDFSGRARRAEYWWFILFEVLVLGLAEIVDYAVGSGPAVLTFLVSLAVFLPSLAVSVRRLHDTGHSGWWVLVNLVPIVGPIVLLVFLLSGGDYAANRYGPSPKAPATV